MKKNWLVISMMIFKILFLIQPLRGRRKIYQTIDPLKLKRTQISMVVADTDFNMRKIQHDKRRWKEIPQSRGCLKGVATITNLSIIIQNSHGNKTSLLLERLGSSGKSVVNPLVLLSLQCLRKVIEKPISRLSDDGSRTIENKGLFIRNLALSNPYGGWNWSHSLPVVGTLLHTKTDKILV